MAAGSKNGLSVASYWEDFLSLIFPQVCVACEGALYKHEKNLCTICQNQLPRTDFHLDKDNPVAKHFWGKVEIENASAFLYFEKGGRVQSLMHYFKYKNMPEVGAEIGELYGRDLKATKTFSDCDLIIPVPLHPSKLLSRGYNQSEFFATGLSSILGMPTDFINLYRAVKTSSQTKKKAYDRFKNMEDIFRLNTPKELENKHILLVDDVVTTGSTLEACANTILKIPGTKISIATMAYAK